MTLCLDASAAIAVLLPHRDRPQVREALLENASAGSEIVAPPLLFAEVTSVLRWHVHRQAITHDEAVIALRNLLSLPVRAVAEPSVYLRALEMARRLGHGRAYDVQYLAVAQMEDCPVLTLDRGMYEGARTLGIAALPA
ncbi:MAG TPA: type II toxin-antitoxin system VapC family toxin [Dehalococcoidia bacterium]|nr:type II toxin-antitoxin system VapC family toxin [Dehalococcoidia bacterium]